MDGPVTHSPINVSTRSKLKSENAAKRARSCVRPGVAVFLHPRPISDYCRYAYADSDFTIMMEHDQATTPQFFGVASVIGDTLADPMYNTVTVGGTVNMLNTGKWPIRQFDRVVVCVPKTTNTVFDKKLYNPHIELEGHCGLVCSSYYTENDPSKDLFTDDYHIMKVGVALSNEGIVRDGTPSNKNSTFSFLVLLDTPAEAANAAEHAPEEDAGAAELESSTSKSESEMVSMGTGESSKKSKHKDE